MINERKRLSLSNQIFTLLLIIAPVINQYQFPGLTFIEYIAVIGLILKFTKNPMIQKNRYLLYSAYGFVVTILMTFIYMGMYKYDFDMIRFIFRIVKYIVVILGIGVSLKQLFDVKYGKKVYTVIIMGVTVLFLFQYLVHLTTGQSIYLLIPNMTLNYNDGLNSSVLMSQSASSVSAGYYFRPSSVFIEPAYYSLYVIPWIAIELFYRKDMKPWQFVRVLIVTICALLTTSTIATVGCIAVWAAFYVHFIRNSKSDRNKLIVIPVIVILGAVVIYFISQNSGIITSTQIKLNSLVNWQESSSITLRLFRGWLYFWNMDLLSKIFGVGYGNLSDYYEISGMHLVCDSNLTQLSYMSGITSVLNTFGVAGLILFLRWIFDGFKSKPVPSKALILILLMLMVGSDFYDTAFYWLIIGFIIAGSENGTENKPNIIQEAA